MKKFIFEKGCRQRGIVVITTSVVLLFSMSMLSLYSAKTAVIEQKVSANSRHVEEAFESAEAGLEFGLAYLQRNRGAILTDADNSGYIDDYSSASTTNASQANGTAFSIAYSNPIPNDYSVIIIQSSGTGMDGVSRAVEQTFAIDAALSNGPPPRAPSG